MAYVKNYDPGKITMDLPTANFIYELPLLSFGDIHGTMGVSLIFNMDMKVKDSNPFHMAAGYKLNMHKKLMIENGEPESLLEANGNHIELLGTERYYTLDDNSQRILRKNVNSDMSLYVIESTDGSMEYYNSLGNIVSVVDKYNVTVLNYIYGSGGVLSEIIYRGNKRVRFSYSGAVLQTITYAGNVTNLVFSTNNALVTHYYGTVNLISCVPGESFHASAKETAASAAIRQTTWVMNSDTITAVVTDMDGTETVNSMEYRFPGDITSFSRPFSQVEMTDHRGVKTRMQYTDREPMCSYEVIQDPEDPSNTIFGAVQIYSTMDEMKNVHACGSVLAGEPKTLGCANPATQMWQCDVLEYANEALEGYYLLTGWIRAKGDSLGYDDNKLCVSNHTGGSEIDFYPDVEPYGQWKFFAYKFYMNANFIYVFPFAPAMVELANLRLAFQRRNVLEDNDVFYTSITEDVLIYPGASKTEYIPLHNATFTFDEQVFLGESEVLFEDLLRYRINQWKNVNTTEFYYNRGKAVVSADAPTSVTVAYGSEQIRDLSDFCLGKRHYTRKGMMITRIRIIDASTLAYETFNENGALISSQTLNTFLDVVSESKNGVTTTYARNNDLITSESVANLYTRTTTYGTDSAGNPTVTKKDEFNKITVYTLDPVWGHVKSVTLPDGNKVVDEYDDGGIAKTKRYFGLSNMRTNLHSYAGGNLSGLETGDLSYTFGYYKGDLTSVGKNGAAIEEHAYADADANSNTEASTESFYPAQTGKLYSTKAHFDKYGRVTEIDGVLANVYDAEPTFDETTGALDPAGDNGGALLAMTTDKVRGEVARYTYDNKGRLDKKTVTDEEDFTQKISQEEFQYDDFNRLTSDTCTYDSAASQTVQSTIAYVPELENPANEARVGTYTYSVGASVTATTQNGYGDPYKRLKSKTYTVGGRAFTKTVNYNKTRVSSEVDSAGGTTSYTYDDCGRIRTVTAGGKATRYTYDEYGQLVREDNQVLDKSYRYVYNGIGNLTGVETFAYTTGALVTPQSTTAFGYTDDRLTSFGGATIAYNAMGCPTTYEGKTATWTKGKLSGLSSGTKATGLRSYQYTYNGFGQRVGKTYTRMAGLSGGAPLTAGELTASSKQYYYDHAGRLIAESGSKTYSGEGTTTDKIVYLYDESSIIGMAYTLNGVTSTYYFHRNLLGDVIGIYNTSGTLVAKYNYDAWGNCTIGAGTTNRTVANANPIRYRGYYYDDDTGLYYCNARYYSPKWRRFISPDDTSYLDPESVNGLNLYCYCNNDPVNLVDPSGNSPTKWWEWALAGVVVAGLVVGAVFTGGLLYGAFLGAAIGAGISLGTQAWQGELNWAQFALDTGVGAITGMLGVSSVSRGLATGLGTVIGGTSNMASQFIQGATWGTINLWEVAVSAVIGGVASYAAGAGARNVKEITSNPGVSKAMSHLTNVLENINTGYYPSASYVELALSTACKRLGYAIVRLQTKMIISSMLWYGGSTVLNNVLTGFM